MSSGMQTKKIENQLQNKYSSNIAYSYRLVELGLTIISIVRARMISIF